MAAPGRSGSSSGWHRTSVCQTAGIFPVPLSLLFRNSLCVALTRQPPSSLFFQPPLTRQFIHLWLASSSGAVWSGARWAGGLQSWPLDGPVPPMLAWPPVRAHRLQKWCCYQLWVDKQQFAVRGAPESRFVSICLCSALLIIYARKEHLFRQKHWGTIKTSPKMYKLISSSARKWWEKLHLLNSFRSLLHDYNNNDNNYYYNNRSLSGCGNIWRSAERSCSLVVALSAPVRTFTNIFLPMCTYSHTICNLWVNTRVFLESYFASSPVLFCGFIVCFCPSNTSSG